MDKLNICLLKVYLLKLLFFKFEILKVFVVFYDLQYSLFLLDLDEVIKICINILFQLLCDGILKGLCRGNFNVLDIGVCDLRSWFFWFNQLFELV